MSNIHVYDIFISEISAEDHIWNVSNEKWSFEDLMHTFNHEYINITN